MPLHIVDAAGEDKAVAGIIAHIARLQILIGGFQSIIAYFVGAVKDQFQLIHLLQGKFAALREVQLRRTGNPVDALRNHVGAVGFHRKIISLLMQEMDEFRIHLQGWFATGKNDEAAIAALLQARSQDVLGAHLFISLEIGITERTFQIAAAHTNKHGWSARPSSFSLKGIEYLVNFIHFS